MTEGPGHLRLQPGQRSPTGAAGDATAEDGLDAAGEDVGAAGPGGGLGGLAGVTPTPCRLPGGTGIGDFTTDAACPEEAAGTAAGGRSEGEGGLAGKGGRAAAGAANPGPASVNAIGGLRRALPDPRRKTADLPEMPPDAVFH